MSEQTCLLEMDGITKHFPGVTALANVSFHLARGEVVALVGENGAGKSTLLKLLGGIHQPDAGTIRGHGKRLELKHPQQAMRAGIGLIHQELNLIPHLSVWENIGLGHERTKFWVDRRGERRRARRLLDRIAPQIPLDASCASLTIAHQQLVEITKALVHRVEVLIMDEPTTSLSPTEADRLFGLIGELRQQGIGIIYVSHRLEEVAAIADRVVVLRDGKTVDGGPLGQMSRRRIIESMVGRSIEQEFPPREHQPRAGGLEVRRLRHGTAVQDVSLVVRRGEVVGLTGLIGAGRTETARLIFGADRREAGSILLDGSPLKISHPRHAIRAGICLLTEDRKHQGLHLDFSVRENFGLPNLPAFSTAGWVQVGRETSRFNARAAQLKLRVPSSETPAKHLSGGNQQKVVLAKWLERHAHVVIFDEPTRGIDVGAKYEIYLLINQLAAAGKAILLISSELPEVLGMSDRAYVMRAGRIAGEVQQPSEDDQAQVMELAVG